MLQRHIRRVGNHGDLAADMLADLASPDLAYPLCRHAFWQGLQLRCACVCERAAPQTHQPEAKAIFDDVAADVDHTETLTQPARLAN